MEKIKQTYKFRIKGMHCKACELLTESELKEFPYINKVKASLKSNLVEIEGDFGDRSVDEVAEEISSVLHPHGYTIIADSSMEPRVDNFKKNIKEFKIAIPITLVFIALYIFLQKIGLVNLLQVKEISYSSAFLIGIIASLSSCMAVVGGLLLSMSASFAKEDKNGVDKLKPAIMFHVGRIVSFFVLGGVIGAIGAVFKLNTMMTFILSFVVAIIMFVLGINLLDVFPWAKKLQIGMPKFLSRHAMEVSKLNHSLTPLFVGLATFFLPCGFTQSMQIATLSTGNFMKGGLVMFFFALGTFPVLALLSFSSFSINKSSKSGIFFKTAGLIVILFAVFNLINSLVVIGILPAIFSF